ncbi:MAG: hypothetical protein EWV68_08750 [Microcystis sp. M_QC_C_20170808_M9Col]|nr:MAG: hypothetical protein EWV68_08750 [Microcystis sp. M_QC_C_20170808_M9Col]
MATPIRLWGTSIAHRDYGTGKAAKSFSVVAGCGVWGFTSFEVANYLIFREKVPKFPPDHSHIQYFLIDKRPKSLTQQGF